MTTHTISFQAGHPSDGIGTSMIWDKCCGNATKAEVLLKTISSTMPPFWLVSWDGAQIQNIPWQPQYTQSTLRASHLDIAIMQVFSHVISSSSATIILSAFGFPRPEDVDVSDETEVLEKANVI